LENDLDSPPSMASGSFFRRIPSVGMPGERSILTRF